MTSQVAFISILLAIMTGSCTHFSQSSDGAQEPSSSSRTNYDKLIERGISLHGLGRYDEAISTYSQAIAMVPGDYFGWYNRAMSKKVSGDRQGALVDLAKAAELDRNDPDAPRQSGVILSQLSRDTEAIESFSQSISRQANALAFSGRAVSRSRTRDYAGAVADATEAIRLGVSDAGIYNTRGMARRHLGDEKGARLDFETALKLSPPQNK
jgi:Flp pilus assembly protein TadD